MIRSHHFTKLLGAATLLAALALPASVQAESLTHFTVDTSSLVANPSGPFSLDFQLNDGSGLGDGNNTAILTNFQFGGGSAVGSATTSGGASGNLASTVLLSDSDALLNEFYQAFTPGSWLSFDIRLSTNLDTGDTPDLFSFSILDGNLWNLPTQALGSDNLIEINLNSTTPSVATFASTDGKITTHVPDAAPTFALCGLGFLGLIFSKRRFGSKTRSSSNNA